MKKFLFIMAFVLAVPLLLSTSVKADALELDTNDFVFEQTPITTGQSSQDAFQTVLVDSQGRVWGGGNSNFDSKINPVLIRYNSDGSRDTSFGDGGVMNLLGFTGIVRNIVEYNEAYYMFGTFNPATDPSKNGVIVKVKDNGTVDTSFGTNGTFYLDGNISGTQVLNVSTSGIELMFTLWDQLPSSSNYGNYFTYANIALDGQTSNLTFLFSGDYNSKVSTWGDGLVFTGRTAHEVVVTDKAGAVVTTFGNNGTLAVEDSISASLNGSITGFEGTFEKGNNLYIILHIDCSTGTSLCYDTAILSVLATGEANTAFSGDGLYVIEGTDTFFSEFLLNDSKSWVALRSSNGLLQVSLDYPENTWIDPSIAPTGPTNGISLWNGTETSMDLIDDNTILVAGESGLDMVMHKVYLYDITFDWGTDDFNGDFTQDGESKTLTIINASPASLTIGDRVLKATSSGATGAELSIDDSQCIGIITATSSCVVTITFNPQNYELSSSSYELSFTTLHTSAEVAAATITTAFDHTLDTDHTSVYRFWNATTLSHFYTVDINEVNYLKANNPAWAYEGPVFTVVKYDSNAEACNLDGSDEVFRFYNTVYGVHFYTADSAEKDYIISTNPNWDYEGVAYCAYKEEATGTTPVYQFWSVARQAHFYTTDAAEKAYVESELGDIYNYEGIVYYVIAL